MRQIMPETQVARDAGPDTRRRGVPWAGAAAAASVTVALAVSACGTVHTGGASALNASALNASAVAGTANPGGVGKPQPAGSPHLAVMPKTKASASPSASAPPASTAPTASAAGGSGAAGGGSGSSTGTDPTCTDPQFTTSAQFGIWNLAPYFVYNNEWAENSDTISQTLYACSYSDWYVVATMINDNGAVQTYPNAQKDFNEPKISSLSSVTSTFAETNPGSGIYEDAYDIWLNGIATSSSTEVMIWNDNHGQTPAGSLQATVTLDGHTWAVYQTTGNYIAFVASSNFSSGTMNLLAFFQWLISNGKIRSDSTLGQVCYGAELVSTNDVPETFTFSNFTVNAS